MKDVLTNMGLSLREAEAYLALLTLKEATVKEIADKTKESRTHLYDTLNSLIKEGLVSYVIRNNIKYFHPAAPERLIDLLKEKESQILRILPELQKISPNSTKPLVEVYEGKEGIKTILNDLLRTKKPWYAIGSYGGGSKILPDFYVENFHQERVRRKIAMKVLYRDSSERRKRAVYLKDRNSEARFLPKSYSSPMTIYLYGDKTALIFWLGFDTPFAILIESFVITKSFHSYFNLLWNLSNLISQ